MLTDANNITEETTMQKIIGLVIFSGDCDPDPEGATAVLRQHGFEVLPMPENFRPQLLHPKDYFLEVYIDAGDSDPGTRAVEVDLLVDRFGATADDFGMLEPDHVPFSFFKQ
jgi:hypothetical protein